MLIDIYGPKLADTVYSKHLETVIKILAVSGQFPVPSKELLADLNVSDIISLDSTRRIKSHMVTTRISDIFITRTFQPQVPMTYIQHNTQTTTS